MSIGAPLNHGLLLLVEDADPGVPGRGVVVVVGFDLDPVAPELALGPQRVRRRGAGRQQGQQASQKCGKATGPR